MRALRWMFLVVMIGLAGYLTRTWAMGEAAAVMVAVLVIALAVIGWLEIRRTSVEPDRAEIIAALKALDAKQQQRELENFMAITSVDGLLASLEGRS